jgi:hypothetical protein
MLYDVYRINDQTGPRIKLNDSPMSHYEACVFKSKLDMFIAAYPHLRNVLEVAIA